MTDPHVRTSPVTAGDLRKFGFTMALAIVFVFGLFIPWAFSLAWLRWPFIVAASLAAPAALAPGLLGPVYVGWMRFAELIGRFNTGLLLGIVFYLVITPIGFVRRRLGADELALRDRPKSTFRKPSAHRPPTDMERPF